MRDAEGSGRFALALLARRFLFGLFGLFGFSPDISQVV
jgi:hypothetical protein